MKLYVFTFLLLFSLPIWCLSAPSNLRISSDGEIESIHIQNISNDNKAKVLALIVADDVLKMSEKLAAENKFLEAHSLSASIVYLDLTNKIAIKKSANYLEQLINDEASRKDVYDNFLREARAGLKNTNSIHKLQVEIALILAKQARDLYPPKSTEYEEANKLITIYNSRIIGEKDSSNISEKLSKEAFTAQASGNYIQAINRYAALYFATNHIQALVRISEILESNF